MAGVRRGRLRPPTDAPATGERTDRLVIDGDRTRVEQILSGRVATPVDYLQDHDEWVMLLAGRAAIEVGDEPVELAVGEWVLLPAHVPHRLIRVDEGTSWLAFHLDRR